VAKFRHNVGLARASDGGRRRGDVTGFGSNQLLGRWSGWTGLAISSLDDTQSAVSASLGDGHVELLQGPFPRSPPVGGPDAHDAPAEGSQNAFAQAVAVTGGFRAVVGSAITLHAEQEAPGAVRVDDRQVDTIAGTANLGLDPVAA